MKRRRGIDKKRVSVVIQEHRSADAVPGFLVHELKFIHDEDISVISTEGIRIPGCFRPDASFRFLEPRNNRVVRLVLDIQPGVDGWRKGRRHLIPEALELI